MSGIPASRLAAMRYHYIICSFYRLWNKGYMVKRYINGGAPNGCSH